MSEWISVKDRLPENEDRILVYDLHNDIEFGFFNMRDKKFKYFDENGYPYEFLYVTHWMPLPKPPKDGDTK